MRALPISFALFALLLPRAAHATPSDAIGPADGSSLACLTAALYYEAAREPLDGQRAVARVVLNRLADPAYPKTVCGVIYQGSTRATGCQFTFTCDGALFRRADPALWKQAGEVAAQALADPDALPGFSALHYHADYVRPAWTAAMRVETRIGHHIFYAAGHRKSGPPSASRAGKPSAVIFSAWGLPIARIAPDAAGGMVIDPTVADPG